jgi:hypothetical protein
MRTPREFPIFAIFNSRVSTITSKC